MSDERSLERVPFARPFGRQVRGTGAARGTLLSAVLHLALIALFVWAGRRQFLDASRAPGPDLGLGGGGGGRGIRGLAVFTASAMGASPTPPPPPVQQPPLTVPQQVQPLPETPPAAPAVPTPQPAAGPGEGAGQGAGAGPGSGTGTGGGVGGGVGTGVGNDSGPGGGGGRIFPPQLQGLIIPPPGVPRELRGTRIVVTFRISERGEVVDVTTDPVIRDRGWRNEFLDRMRRYTFSPAYLPGGHPVAAEYPITITL
jgi:hypothetical protein